MKKVFYTLALTVFTLTVFTSCEPETDKTELADEFATDPNENCPPNDTNCNGVPDNQENN